MITRCRLSVPVCTSGKSLQSNERRPRWLSIVPRNRCYATGKSRRAFASSDGLEGTVIFKGVRDVSLRERSNRLDLFHVSSRILRENRPRDRERKVRIGNSKLQKPRFRFEPDPNERNTALDPMRDNFVPPMVFAQKCTQTVHARESIVNWRPAGTFHGTSRLVHPAPGSCSHIFRRTVYRNRFLDSVPNSITRTSVSPIEHRTKLPPELYNTRPSFDAATPEHAECNPYLTTA